MKNLKNRKGQQALSNTAIQVIVLVFIVAIGATLLQTLRTTQTVNNSDYNVTDAGLAALLTYNNWFTIIVVATVGFFVIALFRGGFGGGSR